MKEWIDRIFGANFEALIWMGGLLYLALSNPSASDHFSFCVFRWLGFERCPGCGLGHSMSYLFQGDVYQSFQAHPLGVFAVAILSFRIVSILKKTVNREDNTRKQIDKKGEHHGKYHGSHAGSRW